MADGGSMEAGALPTRSVSSGTCLYSLEVLLTYFALGGLPMGVFLYGLNVARRGQPLMGHVLSALAAVAFTLGLWAPDRGWGGGFDLYGFDLYVGILVGIGVLKSESGPYRAALARGATPARWWPPMVVGVAVALVSGFIEGAVR